MICFAFPLAHEAESLLKLCRQKDQFSVDGVHCAVGNLGRRTNVLIARIGMGEAAAADSTATIFEYPTASRPGWRRITPRKNTRLPRASTSGSLKARMNPTARIAISSGPIAGLG